MTNRNAAARAPESTHYVNVDLDLYSRVPLDGLVRALGDDAFVLYVGGKRRKYEAQVELASSHLDMSADDTIVGLTRLIRRLGRVHRRTWNSAQRREFNLGIEAGLEPHGFELRLQERTLEAITDVRGVLVITSWNGYGSMRRAIGSRMMRWSSATRSVNRSGASGPPGSPRC